MFGILNSDGLGKISVNRRIGDVQCVRRVISENPRKDGILIEIVVGSSSDGVDHHQIIEIRQFACDPFLGDFRFFQNLVRRNRRRQIREDTLHAG